MLTVRDAITVDANGDGTKAIGKFGKRVLVGNLRGFFDGNRVEFFRLYITVAGTGEISESGGGGGGGGGGPVGASMLSPLSVSRGIVVEGNQVITVNVEAGTAYALDTCYFAFDSEEIK